MDFFAHQERARRNTVWLIIYFLVTIVAIIALVYFGVAGIAHAATRNDEQPIDFFVFHPRLFVGVVGAVLTVILSGSFYKTLQLAGDGHRVAVELGGVKVQPNSRDLDERVLLNVVEEMANMISASRSYDANVQVADAAKQMLTRTLSLGQR